MAHHRRHRTGGSHAGRSLFGRDDERLSTYSKRESFSATLCAVDVEAMGLAIYRDAGYSLRPWIQVLVLARRRTRLRNFRLGPEAGR